MSQTQLEQREAIRDLLLKADWKLKNVEAFDHDLWLDAEVSGRKRVPGCIMEINYSFENSYVNFTAANFKEGRAEYVVYFDSFEKSVEIVRRVLSSADGMTVLKAAQLSLALVEAYPGDVFFFTGDESIELTTDNALEVFERFNNEVA